MQIAACTSLDEKEKNGDFLNLNNPQQHHSFPFLFFYFFFASVSSRLMLPQTPPLFFVKKTEEVFLPCGNKSVRALRAM